MNFNQQSIVLITGASSGIGAQLALDISHRFKSTLVLVARTESALHEVAAKARLHGSSVWVYPTDVSNEEDVKKMAHMTLKNLGHVDVVINNAGFGHYASVQRLDSNDLKNVLGCNLYGALYVTQAFLPHMKERRHGHIVFVSSIIGVRAVPFMSAYCMSKFALNALSESLMIELKPFGLGVSLICPGLTHTAFQTNASSVDFKPLFSNAAGMHPKKVACAIVSAIEKNKKRVYLTLGGKTMVWLERLCPSMVDWIVYFMFSRKKFEKPLEKI